VVVAAIDKSVVRRHPEDSFRRRQGSLLYTFLVARSNTQRLHVNPFLATMQVVSYRIVSREPLRLRREAATLLRLI
jgi:hypothetical protein